MSATADQNEVSGNSTPPPTDAQQLSRRINHLQALHRIGLAMASTMNSAEIIREVLHEVVALTNASCATIYLNDPQSHRLIPEVSFGEEGQVRPLDLIDDDELPVVVAHTGSPRQVTENDAACPQREGMPVIHCRLCVPMLAGDEIVGVIDIKMHTCSFVEHDLEEMLATMASQTALVFRNASVHEELEQHYREVSLLYEIQQEISSTFNYQKVLTLIVDRTKRLFNARECTIRLISETGGRRIMRIVATTGRQFFGPQQVPLDEAHLDKLVFGGEMLHIDDVRTDSRFLDREEAEKAGVVSMLCAPLVARRRIIGTIRLYTGERRDFDVSDRKMFLAVAGMAATAIDHSRLYAQVEAKNRELSASYEQLRRTQKELVKREKLAALGEMAATVAHEIRNPLTSIRGFAQRIAKRQPEGGDVKLSQYTSIIMEEVDRLNKFIKDVLDFARRMKPQLERANVNTILSSIITFMREELAWQDIVVLNDLDMNVNDIVVDKTLIRQMFLNLLQNARHAMGPKGMLIIKTQNSGDYVRIRIADDGHGIPPEVLQKIWSPFFTTKTQGTGLGLSLVQRIVEDHHGQIQVRSKVGKGTVVDMFFPKAGTPEALSEQE